MVLGLRKAVFFLVVLAFGLGLMARSGIHLISTNYNIAAESNGLFGALRVAQDKPLYPSETDKPFHIYLYPPLHAWVVGTIQKLFTSLHAQVVVARLISLWCFLLVVYFLFRQVRSFSPLSPFHPSVFVGVTLLMLPKFADYMTSARNDCFALLLSISALMCFLRYLKTSQKIDGVGFLLLSFLAMMARQTEIVVPLATLLFLVREKKFKLSLLLVMGYLGLGLGVLGGLDALTRGAYYYHIFEVNFRDFREVSGVVWNASFLSFLASYVLYFFLVVRGMFVSRPPSDDLQDKYQRTVLMLSTVCFSILLFRSGGDVNYFFLPLLLSLKYAYFGALEMVRRGWEKHKKRDLSLFLLQCMVAAMVLWVKFDYSLKSESLNLHEAAQYVKTHYPSGVVLGHLGAGLNVHLKDWSYVGPQILNADNFALTTHIPYQWVKDEIVSAIVENKIKSVVIASPGCGTGQNPILSQEFRVEYETFPYRENVRPWLCVFSASEKKIQNLM